MEVGLAAWVQGQMGHRGTEHQLPGRRRGGAPVDGHADATWLRLAGALLFRGGRGGCNAGLQWVVLARVAQGFEI